MDQIAELCMPFCLFYAICCEMYDILIYALYPESFCVENLDIRLFLTLICKTKEFGLNRETKRFMKLQITVDKFHQVNHTSCGDTFKSRHASRPIENFVKSPSLAHSWTQTCICGRSLSTLPTKILWNHHSFCWWVQSHLVIREAFIQEKCSCF